MDKKYKTCRKRSNSSSVVQRNSSHQASQSRKRGRNSNGSLNTSKKTRESVQITNPGTASESTSYFTYSPKPSRQGTERNFPMKMKKKVKKKKVNESMNNDKRWDSQTENAQNPQLRSIQQNIDTLKQICLQMQEIRIKQQKEMMHMENMEKENELDRVYKNYPRSTQIS